MEPMGPILLIGLIVVGVAVQFGITAVGIYATPETWKATPAQLFVWFIVVLIAAVIVSFPTMGLALIAAQVAMGAIGRMRCNEARRDKSNAFWMIVPIVGVFVLVLLRRSEPTSEQRRHVAGAIAVNLKG